MTDLETILVVDGNSPGIELRLNAAKSLPRLEHKPPPT